MAYDIGFLFFLVVLFAAAVLLPDAIKSLRVYRKRKMFRCQMCGNCCRFRVTPLTSKDIKRLEDAGYNNFYVVKGEAMIKRVRGKCFFLRDDRCTVHKVRPDVCREFPFFETWGMGYAQKASFCPALEDIEDG
ncbi:MAG: YkgJ family cysteine cluster protein [Candidatus Altiarchaeota archaeon]|nr:YkgJ family cysteine cluster protein [Candidatus Altiarchaeota archaeon]